MSEHSEIRPGSVISGVERVLQSLSKVDELFHRVSRTIPPNQQILVLDREMLARDAIKLLTKNFYSQAPVSTGTKVLGVFSFRSFAQHAAACSLKGLNSLKHAPGDLTVEECMEQLDFANLSDEIHKHFDALERDNGVLVGVPETLSAILTPMCCRRPKTDPLREGVLIQN